MLCKEMETKKTAHRNQAALFFLGIFVLILIGLSLAFYQKDKANRSFSILLNGFQSEFDRKDGRLSFIKDQVYKKNRFLAYGRYATIPPGIYKGTFSVDSVSGLPSVLELQLAEDKGRDILFKREFQVNNYPSVLTVSVIIPEEKEIEPRLLFLSGSQDLKLEEVLLQRTKGLLPWKNILLQSLFAAALATLIFLAVLHTFQPAGRWTYFIALFFFVVGFFLILHRAWISEDAFITLRHVDNLINGYGPNFNPGERVEGYSHPLWFGILVLFRLFGISAKGAAVVPGLFFSLAALYLLFFKVRFSTSSTNAVQLNPAAIALVGASAFIDFGTSGLETALSYFLLVLLAKFIAEDKWKTKPLLTGLIVTMLVLTRPDFGVFLLFLIPFYVYEFVRKRSSLRDLFTFLTFPSLILGLHELFRMGYYAALMPNPFYAKSGSSAHFLQGLRYFVDFGRGSLSFIILFLAALSLWLTRKQNGIKNRWMVLTAGVFHGFFVIRGGGDFMHGRFLLPAFLLISVSVAGAFDQFGKKKIIFKNVMILASILLFFLALSVRPIQKRGAEISHGIADERDFYYKSKTIPLKYLSQDTMILIWKTLGQNYRWLSEEARLNIRLAQTNIGFLGYYGGKHVYLIDRLGLTDPVVSRVAIEKRTRPGHEKHAPLGYLMLRKLTFADTLFPLWNEVALTKFGILWDLSPQTLKKLRSYIKTDIKETIDAGIKDFLINFDGDEMGAQADFLFFLKEFWYPFATEENKSLFENIYEEETVARYSTGYLWMDLHGDDAGVLLSHLQGPLNMKKIFRNIGFALTRGRNFRF
jgi:arabinofuranosyltransferase